MRNLKYIFQFLVAALLFTSCEVEPLKPTGETTLTPVYRVYSSDINADIEGGVYDMYVYANYPKVTQYKAYDYSGISIYRTENMVDLSTDTDFDIKFTRITESINATTGEVTNVSRKYYELSGPRDEYILNNPDGNEFCTMKTTTESGTVVINDAVMIVEIMWAIEK